MSESDTDKSPKFSPQLVRQLFDGTPPGVCLTSVIKPKFYTTSYTDQNFEQLKPLAERLDGLVVDIRFVADTVQLEWTKNYLKLLLRERYRHLPLLGDRNQKKTSGAKIEIHNLELGLKTLIGYQQNCLLLCGCSDFSHCHRAIISRALAAQGFETAEIKCWSD